MSKKRITVVGNGFASLFFIQYLLAMPVFPFFAAFFRKIYSKYEITLIGNGKFIYFPAIPEFITGKKCKKNITVDIRPFLRRRNITFIDDWVIDIRDGGRTVITHKGTYHNDALFLGIGPAFLKADIPGTQEYTLSPCSGPDEMALFIEKLESLDRGIIYLGFKINKKDDFVAGRAGQMYECACLLDYALKEKGTRKNFEIHFFSSHLNPDAQGAITDRMHERDIILDYGYEPVEFVDGGMLDADGTLRKADLVLFSSGITAPELARDSCLTVSPGGHIDVDRYGQVKNLSHVFAAGDCANHEAPPQWVPHQAHMAQLRARAAAKNMNEVLRGKSPTHTYRHELSCILNMGNDAMWLHASSDNKPPFRNIFPRHSKKLIHVKNLLEKIYLTFLRHL